tara:strand:- start:10998 stop:11552 length:555 start_codon:yes stop_codon:yes gene_type:complete
MKLETKRLILRQIKMSDTKDLVEAINNLNISKWLLAVPYPYTMKDAKWFVNHAKEKWNEKPITSYEFAVILKSEDKLIGGTGLSNVDKEQGTAELGYWIAEPHWRQGYVRESTTKLIELAFDKLKLRRLKIPAYKTNQGSNGLAKHLGFTYEGCLRKAMKCKATGKIHDENIWGLLKSEWRIRK